MAADKDDQPETDSSPMLPKYHSMVATVSDSSDDLVAPKASLFMAESKDSMGLLSNNSDHTTSTVGETSHASGCSSFSGNKADERAKKLGGSDRIVGMATQTASSSLAAFFSQLLGDITNQAGAKTESPAKPCEVSLVQDNARAHGDRLELVQQRPLESVQQREELLSSAFHFQGMIVSVIDDNVQRRPPIHPRVESFSAVATKNEVQEQRQEPATSVRVPQRPCRWSPNNSFNKGTPAAPNSPPLKVDNSPTLPARRLSSDGLMTAPVMADPLLLVPSSDSNTNMDIRDVLALLEHEAVDDESEVEH